MTPLEHDAPREVALEDGELRLRAPRREEAGLYSRWWSDEEVQWGFCSDARSAEDIIGAMPELEAEARDIGHWIDWVLEVRGEPIGYVWFSHWDLETRCIDLNILIGASECRRRGLARRAIRLVCRWAFPAMGLARIYLCPREDHLPALRCYLAAGAHLGGIREDVMTWRGEIICFRETYLEAADFASDERTEVRTEPATLETGPVGA